MNCQRDRKRKTFWLLTTLLVVVASISSYAQTTYYSRSDGNWNTPASWSVTACNGPAAASFPQLITDKVIVCHKIDITTNTSLGDLQVNAGGQVSLAGIISKTVSINGNLLIQTTGIIQNSTTNPVANMIQVHGNIDNSGQIDLFSNNLSYTDLSLIGTTKSVLTGSGSWSLNQVKIDKSSSELEAEFGSATVYADIQGQIEIISGIYHQNANVNYSLTTIGDYTLNSFSGITLTRGVLNLSPAGNAFYLEGKLQMLGGTLLVGKTDATGASGLKYRRGTSGNIPAITIAAGDVVVYQGISNATTSDGLDFTISGGTLTLNAGTVPAVSETFEINDVSSSKFIITGGSIIFRKTNGAGLSDFQLCAMNGTINCSNGTLQFGDALSSSQVFRFTAQPSITLPHVSVDGRPGENITLAPSNLGSINMLTLRIGIGKFFDISHAASNTDNRLLRLVGADSFDNTFTDLNTDPLEHFIYRNSRVNLVNSGNLVVNPQVATNNFYNLSVGYTGKTTTLTNDCKVASGVAFSGGNFISLTPKNISIFGSNPITAVPGSVISIGAIKLIAPFSQLLPGYTYNCDLVIGPDGVVNQQGDLTCEGLHIDGGGNVSIPSVYITNNYQLTVNKNLMVGVAAGAATKTLQLGSSDVLVKGNLLLEDDGVIAAGSATITLEGNWTNQSQRNPKFQESVGKVIFAGAQPQTISNPSENEAFYNLEINKSAGEVTLHVAVSVAHEVIFTKGNIHSTLLQKLTVRNNAIATGASVLSFVKGPVEKVGKGAFAFPVGKSAVYRPISIAPNGAVTDAFTAEYFDEDPDPTYSTNNKEASVSQVGRCEYWKLTRDAGTAATEVSLSYGAGSCDLTGYQDFKVVQYNGAQWTDQGRGLATGDATQGTVTSANAVTTFGPFTFMACNTPNIVITGSTTLCSGQQTTLSSNHTATNYLWSTGQTTSSITVSSAGNYQLQTTNGSCTKSSQNVQIFAGANPSPPTAINGRRCGPGKVFLSATGAADFKWYTSSVGGTGATNPSPYETSSLSSNTDFYVTAVSSLGCESTPRTIVKAIIDNIPPAPTTTSANRCGEGSADLQASGAVTYRWYASSTSNMVLDTHRIFTSPSIAATTSYYVAARSTEGCESSTRAAGTITINAPPARPTATGGSRCGSGRVLITATGSNTYQWFDVMSGGTALAVTGLYQPNLTTTATFYVAAVSAAGCISTDRSAAVATIHPIPPTPTSQNKELCGPGSVTLEAQGAASYRWYAGSTGSVLLASTPDYNPGNISATTSYYVSSRNTQGCESTRQQVIVSINSIPAKPIVRDTSRCGAGQISINASGGNTYKWYDSTNALLQQGSGTFTTTIANQTSFFASAINTNGCESAAKTKAVASLLPLPAAPLASGGQVCGNGRIILKAHSAASYRWYTDSLLTAFVSNDSNFTTPDLSSSRYYFLTSLGQNQCESRVTKVFAKVNIPPQPPVLSDKGRCSPGIVVLHASSLHKIFWFDTLGVILDSGATFTTPFLSESRKYLAGSKDANSCQSPTRSVVSAIITGKPGTPTVVSGVRCGTGTVQLEANGSATGKYAWFSSQDDTNILDSNGVFITPAISQTDTFYVSVKTGEGCISDRKEVMAAVNPNPTDANPVPVTKCGPGSVELQIDTVGNYRWYNAASQLLFEGNRLTAAVGEGETTFKVTKFSSQNCESIGKSDLVVTVYPLPARPLCEDKVRCGPGEVTFTPGSAARFVYYNKDTVKLSADSLTYTIRLDTTSVFFITSLNANGCESEKLKITGVINDAPLPPQIQNTSRCGAGMVTFRNAQPLYWYGSLSDAHPIVTADTFQTPSLTNTTQFFASIKSGQCESARQVVTATILSLPLQPAVMNDSTCGPGSILLKGNGNDIHQWFSDSQYTNLLFEGGQFSTPIITSTTNYHVRLISSGGCVGSGQLVKAIITTKAPLPVVSNAFRCGPGQAKLLASGAANFDWFASDNAQIPLFTGNTFSTPVLNKSTSYFVESFSGSGCRSTRKEVIVQVGTISDLPSGMGDTLCAPGQMLLRATGGVKFHWYNTITDSLPISDTSQFRTPRINQTTTFYLSSINEDKCESARIAVKAVIANQPFPPIVPSARRCNEGSLDIVLSGSTGSYVWYENRDSPQHFYKGTTFTTPALQSNKVYFVAANNPQGCESPRIALTAFIDLPTMGGATGPGATVCEFSNRDSIRLTGARGRILHWESTKDEFATIKKLADTTRTLIYDGLDTTTTYRALVKNGACPQEYSQPVTINTVLDVKAGTLLLDNIAERGLNQGELQLINYVGTIERWKFSDDGFNTEGEVVQPTSTLPYNNLIRTRHFKVFVVGKVCPPTYSNIVKIIIKSKPVLRPDTFALDNVSKLVFETSILKNDFSPDGDQLLVDTLKQLITPGGGSISIDIFGQVTYTPMQNFTGVDSIPYKACVAGTQSIICNKSKIYIYVRGEPYKIYPAISPNEDGLNDTWEITNIEKFPNNTLKVFDRWGNLVYEQHPYNNTTQVWKGTANRGIMMDKSVLPDGTYFYMLDLGNKSKIATGYVELKR